MKTTALHAIEQAEQALAAAKRELLEAPETEEATPILMKKPEYAARRRVSLATLNRWIAAGMPVEQRGRVVRIPVVRADEWNALDEARRAATIAASKGRIR